MTVPLEGRTFNLELYNQFLDIEDHLENYYKLWRFCFL